MFGIKTYAEKVLRNFLRRRRIEGARRGEINKFKDSRRVAIFSKINLTDEQKKQIDDFYLENYGEKIPYTWHRHFTAFTGNFDYKYFPELLYIPEFEYFMNEKANYHEVFSDKNVLPLIAKSVGIKTPQLILSRTYGVFRDENYRFISKEGAADLLIKAGKVFVKPSVNSCSGVGCQIVNPENLNEAYKIFDNLGANFVIQECLSCHEDISKIYSGSVNTFRIITYVWHEKIKHTLSLLRIGRGGKFLDNAHAGGMFIAIDDDGTLHEKAFTEFNKQFTEHPDTHLKFNGHKIKNYPDVIKAAEKMHEAIPQVGIINWDFTIDKSGTPILIEGNMAAGGIWLAEMAHGKGLFGDDTAEILQWTRKMKDMSFSQRQALNS